MLVKRFEGLFSTVKVTGRERGEARGESQTLELINRSQKKKLQIPDIKVLPTSCFNILNFWTSIYSAHHLICITILSKYCSLINPYHSPTLALPKPLPTPNLTLP